MFGLEIIDLLVVIGYLVGITAVGYLSKAAIHNEEDFLLAGRKLGIPLMVMHSFGTGTHTDQAAGVVAKSYQHGISGIWAQWNWMLCTPFYWILAPLLRRTRCLTVADVYEEMFGKSVSILVVVVSSLGTALAMGVMLLGTSRTIQGLLGIPPEVDILNLFGYQLHDASFYVCLVVITALFMLYGTAGGIVGAVRTDFIQGICIIILSGLALPFAFSAVGGMDGLRTGVAEQGKSMALIGDEFSPLMIFALLLTALFSIVSQSHIMSVTSSGKTEWEGRVGMTYGNFLKRFCTVGWCLLGVCWIVKNPTIQNPDMVFGEAIGNLLPIGFRGLMMASIMAAAMSSCDSMMIAVAGLFTENVYKKHVKPGQDEKHYVNVSRVVGIVVVVISIGFAMVTPDIYSGLKTFWKITATIGIAWWLGMFWRRANSAGAWASFLASAGILTYMNYAEGLGLPGADLIGTLND
ncbi:MAG TPA: sodium:solute symporter family protein, partial [Armatimonadota bacterium]|nr:sodium:solute symporter family protein [Armatimonadota bacterium]